MALKNWRSEGKEPDYRFSLANERTFLAWIRTALGLLAGGLLLDQLSVKLAPRVAVLTVALSLCVLATVLCGMAYGRWRDNEIAMRHSRPLPQTPMLWVLAGTTLLVAGTLGLLVVLGHTGMTAR